MYHKLPSITVPTTDIDEQIKRTEKGHDRNIANDEHHSIHIDIST